MQIRTDTWHYKVWNFTYLPDGLIDWWGRRPYKPSLCQYWRRIMLFTVPTAIIVSIFLALAAAVYLVIQVVWILSGTGVFLGGRNDEHHFFPAVTVGGRSVQPQRAALWFWGALALAGALYYGLAYHNEMAEMLLPIWGEILFIGPYALGILGILLTLVLAGFLFDASRKSEGWSLFKAYLQAKKDGICPRIEFVEVHQKEEAS